MAQPMSNFKFNLYHKLGLSCLFPKFLRPVQPAIESIRSSLGLGTYEERKGFIDSAPCSCNMCKKPNLENKPITRNLGLPNMDYPTYEKVVTTMDQCFQDMDNVTYGSRVIVKLVDDQPCSDPKYESICEEQMNQNRVLYEEDCQASWYRIFDYTLRFIDRIICAILCSIISNHNIRCNNNLGVGIQMMIRSDPALAVILSPLITNPLINQLTPITKTTPSSMDTTISKIR